MTGCYFLEKFITSECFLRFSLYTWEPFFGLQNAVYTDSSYKWAAAGMLSSVVDLTVFANVLLQSYHNSNYLQQETMRKMWTILPNTALKWHEQGGYGLGFQLVPLSDGWFCAGHSGSAIGQSSVLLILTKGDGVYDKNRCDVTIAIVANMEKMDLSTLALDMAKSFRDSKIES